MEVLSQRYEVETLDVNALGFAPLTPVSLADRDSGKVDERALPIARRIAAADRLVIAAPFWDMSFPAALKAFLESVSLFGVTFTDDGKTSAGLCRCRRLCTSRPAAWISAPARRSTRAAPTYRLSHISGGSARWLQSPHGVSAACLRKRQKRKSRR